MRRLKRVLMCLLLEERIIKIINVIIIFYYYLQAEVKVPGASIWLITKAELIRL
jgi:hypothetical protein